MKLGFRKRIKVAPGVTLNVGKQSASVRVGVKGAGVTSGTEGTRASGSIPKTGLTVTQNIAGKPGAKRKDQPNVSLIAGIVVVTVLAIISYAIFTALSN